MPYTFLNADEVQHLGEMRIAPAKLPACFASRSETSHDLPARMAVANVFRTISACVRPGEIPTMARRVVRGAR